ncbi:MAG: CHRD domain-containing protein, partial [Candidatus Omnitrophica bacterium]|nr:CHRD domain-containing protein [Candidatus Omnitrophota bacterium]
TMAHLHLGAAGTNGDHIAWLYPPEPPPKEIPGEFNGTLADGSITADHLMGPMAGKSIADLVAKMKAGDIYVNVHTKAQPDGEIRGQVH